MKPNLRLVLLLTLMVVCGGCRQEESIWRQFGEQEAEWINLEVETRTLLNQFPLIQILDKSIDFTSGIVFFRVKDEYDKEYELFYRYWDEKWIKRIDNENGSYSFIEMPGWNN